MSKISFSNSLTLKTGVIPEKY